MIDIVPTRATQNTVVMAIEDHHDRRSDTDMRIIRLLYDCSLTGKQWLQLMCTINNWGSKHLADIIEMSQFTVDGWRSGKANPSVATLELLSNQLRMPQGVRW